MIVLSSQHDITIDRFIVNPEANFTYTIKKRGTITINKRHVLNDSDVFTHNGEQYVVLRSDIGSLTSSIVKMSDIEPYITRYELSNEIITLNGENVTDGSYLYNFDMHPNGMLSTNTHLYIPTLPDFSEQNAVKDIERSYLMSDDGKYLLNPRVSNTSDKIHWYRDLPIALRVDIKNDFWCLGSFNKTQRQQLFKQWRNDRLMTSSSFEIKQSMIRYILFIYFNTSYDYNRSSIVKSITSGFAIEFKGDSIQETINELGYDSSRLVDGHIIELTKEEYTIHAINDTLETPLYTCLDLTEDLFIISRLVEMGKKKIAIQD